MADNKEGYSIDNESNVNINVQTIESVLRYLYDNKLHVGFFINF